MAITAIIQTAADSYAGRAAGNYMRFRVDTESELPIANVIDGDSGFASDTGHVYIRTGNAWVDTSDVIAHKTTHENGGTDELALDISQTTGLQAALDGKQVAGSYATGSGSASGTNTGDNATNTQYSGLAASKQDTLVSGTNIKTINGSAVLGAGDLVVTGAAPAFTAFTKDLGVSRRSGTFDITGLSGLTADKVVSVVQTADAIASKGNAVDEYEMDPITLNGTVLNATTIRANWACAGGRSVAVGTYAFAYQVSG